MNADELHGAADGTDADGMFADLGHFTTGAIPVDAVVKRGAAIRNRRRVVGGGVLAAAAALTIAVPVALAGGRAPDAAPTSGHSIVVDRPTEDSAQKITFSGSIDGKVWSRTFRSHCGTEPKVSGAECMIRLGNADDKPVGMILSDEWHKEGDFYGIEFGPGTEFAILKLDTGDEVTVPAFVADDGYRVGYYQVPRHAKVKQIVAYGKEGKEIGRTTAANVSTDRGGLDGWIRPDGGKLDVALPTVHVAEGATGGTAWSIDATVGPYDQCFRYKIAARTSDMCPESGARVYMNGIYAPGPKDGVVLGEVDPKTTRVDVTFKDGTVQRLIPIRSKGHSFVGTYVPDGATVVSVEPVTGTNG